ncbi:helix-turn-helix domain-containing protein [Pectobacterium brasiliense]|nr:helix-turn-helix domain-containing protein [Pectobacterium brasiliense]
MSTSAISEAIELIGSQQKLATACGVKQPTVWAWLHGKKKVSAENAKRIEIATNGAIPSVPSSPRSSAFISAP